MAGTNSIGSQYFGIAEETKYGTAVAPTRLLEPESDDFRREVQTDIRAGFRKGQETSPLDRARAITMGAVGSIQIPAYFDGMGILWRSAFGTAADSKNTWAVSQSGSKIYNGSYASDLSGQRKSYTAMIRRADEDGDLNPFYYTGMTCHKLTVNVAEGEAVMLTFEYAGAGEETTASGTEAAAVHPNTGWFHYDDCVLSVNGTEFPVGKSIDLVFDFGLNLDTRYLTGTAARAKPGRSKRPLYTGTIESNMRDLALHTAWTSASKVPVQLKASHPAIVGGKNVGVRELVIDLGATVVTSAPPVSSLEDFTQQSIEFQGMWESGSHAVEIKYSSIDTAE